MSEELSSGKEVRKYVLDNKLDTSATSLLVYGKSRGYELIKYK